MPTPEYLRALLNKYETLDRQALSLGDGAQEKSLQFFRLDRSSSNGVNMLSGLVRTTVWIRAVKRVDEFLRVEGRLPRENNRVKIDFEERSLSGWLRYQKRAATRAHHVKYQTSRLETLPGFYWNPRDSSWNLQRDRWVAFVVTNRRAPMYRSTDLNERAAAAWAAKQRSAHKGGKLHQHRARELGRLDFWVWSK